MEDSNTKYMSSGRQTLILDFLHLHLFMPAKLKAIFMQTRLLYFVETDVEIDDN